MSELTKVDHITYACAAGSLERWTWYHIEIEGGTLINRIDDVRPQDPDSSMKIWCIDYGGFGIALVEGIDRAGQSQVTRFVERHGDHACQHVAYACTDLDAFRARLEERGCRPRGSTLVRHDGFGVVKQMFAKGYDDSCAGEASFAEYVERPSAMDGSAITFSQEAGKGFYEQIEEAIATADRESFVDFATMPEGWRVPEPSPQAVPAVEQPSGKIDLSVGPELSHLKAVALTPPLHDYLIEHGLPADPVGWKLRAHTEDMDPELARMQVPVEEGALLTQLARLTGAQAAIEIGTFTGYSAMCIARGLGPNGRLLTCDISRESMDVAETFWRKAGLEDRITSHVGPALGLLRSLPTSPQYDLAFIDADKEGYIAYWEELVPRMRPGGLFLVDNVLCRGQVLDPDATPRATVIHAFNLHAAADPRVEIVILPISDGLTIARVTPPADTPPPDHHQPQKTLPEPTGVSPADEESAIRLMLRQNFRNKDQTFNVASRKGTCTVVGSLARLPARHYQPLQRVRRAFVPGILAKRPHLAAGALRVRPRLVRGHTSARCRLRHPQPTGSILAGEGPPRSSSKGAVRSMGNQSRALMVMSVPPAYRVGIIRPP
ncbi:MULTISPECIES: class I SAM-dependent methyltransferase [unclassified Streptomyces]|uniref:class I SAM-dependent methyltransferase n=1 Tax=unclassified Streptomyces TaxID=2593676 RepID=UPI00344FDFAF